jgi:hypothetical protein
MLVLVGCIREGPQGVPITNDLSDRVEIVYLKNGETSGGTLEPGAERIFPFDLLQWGVSERDSCTTADLVARTVDGQVVARMPPPVCINKGIRLSNWLVP